jgi:8-oxo-dGTP pyrophosphatase MutT (NUDIX family)
LEDEAAADGETRAEAVPCAGLSSLANSRASRVHGKAMPAPRSLVELLDAVVPADDKERRDLALLRAYSLSLPEPFSREQPVAHFTGSALVTDGARVALVFHRKLSRWLQPGGHAEPEDAGDLTRTALREAHEETGLPVRLHASAPQPLDVDVHTIPARPDASAHLHLDVRFLVVAESSAALVMDAAEIADVRWFAMDQALEQADDASLRRLLLKAGGYLG